MYEVCIGLSVARDAHRNENFGGLRCACTIRCTIGIISTVITVGTVIEQLASWSTVVTSLYGAKDRNVDDGKE